MSERGEGAENERTYRAVVEAAFDGYWMADDEGRILDVNEAYVRLSGFSREELLGMRISDLEAAESRAETAAHIAKLIHGGSDRFETTHRAKNGVLWHLEANVTFHPKAGRRFYSFFRDITERKAAQADLERRVAERTAALAESETRLRRTLDGLFTFVALLDTDGTGIDVNGAPLRAAGLSREDVLGRKFWACPWWTYDAAVSDRIRDAVAAGAQGASRRFDVVIRTRNEGRMIIDFMLTPLLDSAGRVERLVPSAVDITDRVRMEEGILGQERRLRMALAAARMTTWEWDLVSNAIRYSDNAVDLARGEDLTPYVHVESLYRQLHPEDLDRLRTAVERTRNEGVPLDCEYRVLMQDGKYYWIHGQGSVVSTEGGRPTRVLGVSQDVTARRTAEGALRESETRLIESQRTAGIGHFDLEIPSITWTGSKMLEEIYGIEPAERRTREDWKRIIHPDDREAVRTHFDVDVLRGGRPFDLEYRVIRARDGEERWVHGAGRLVVDAAGRPVRLSGTIQDITGRKRAETALRESEERYRLTVESLHEGLYTTKDGVFVNVNDAICRIFGYPRDELIGRPAWELAVPEIRDRIRSAFGAMARERRFDAMMVECLTKDGERIIAEVRLSGFLPTGEAFGIVLDITDRVQAETALRANEERLRQLGDRIPKGAVYRLVHAPDGRRRFEYGSAGLGDLFGVDLDSLLRDADVVYRSLHPDDAEAAVAAERAALEDLRPFSHECRFFVGGAPRWLQWSSRPVRRPDGTIVWDGICLDVTERRHAEGALRESEEKFARAFQTQALLQSIRTYPEGRLVEANDAWYRFFGITPEEAIGRRQTEIDIFAGGHPPWEISDEFRTTGSIRDIEVRVPTRHRGDRTVVFSAERVRLGEHVFIFSNAVDITARKRAEEALRRAERDAAVGRLAGTVAHQINNPLAAIKARLAVLRTALEEREEIVRRLDALSDQVDRISHTVQKLLGFSRERASSIERGDLADVLRRVVDLFQDGYRSRGVALSMEIPDGFPPVPCSVDRLQDVLVNLLENAREILAPGRGVRVAAAAREDGVEIVVEDDGPGLGEFPATVFEPFFTTREGGTGLGLAIAQSLAEEEGGRLEAENRPPAEGGGARFRLRLPRPPPA